MEEMKKKTTGRALDGMKEICGYVRRTESTVLKWVRELGFPAKKVGGGIWQSETALIDEWRTGQINGNGGK